MLLISCAELLSSMDVQIHQIEKLFNRVLLALSLPFGIHWLINNRWVKILSAPPPPKRDHFPLWGIAKIKGLRYLIPWYFSKNTNIFDFTMVHQGLLDLMKISILPWYICSSWFFWTKIKGVPLFFFQN